MNYFDFYDLPVKFGLDTGKLKRNFLLKSKASHPDYFTLASAEEQARSLKESSLNNQAYKVLSDKNLRTKYILELKNILVDGEKEKLPMEFLMEMMDFNELIQEAEDNPKLTDKIKNTLSEKLEKLNKLEQSIFEQFDKTNDVTLLEEIKRIYFERKYLERTRIQMD